MKLASSRALLDVIADQKQGGTRGAYSICSASRHVLEACARLTAPNDLPLLIEATCNQVNQYGGYTGMSPHDFARYAAQIVETVQRPGAGLLLGGDHLGPSPWHDEPARSAMNKARQMVRDYVLAGFVKIHLDASMHCSDDDQTRPLDAELSAERAADLCEAAEQARREAGSNSSPVYVVGTEVPTPGGAQGTEESIRVTEPDDARETISLLRDVFQRRGLADAWTRVIALVVQPGVEFDQAHVIEYDRARASALSHMIETVPGMVFEAHSTDYQRPAQLRQLVQDHFAILKVGPALTFAFREAVFALAGMEAEWLAGRNGVELSSLIDVAEQSMLDDRQYWARYYQGSAAEQALARKYSFSDRIRYYWSKPELAQALQQLAANLENNPPPLSLVSQYLPLQYWHIREGRIRNNPHEIIWDHIQEIAAHYVQACWPNG